MPELAAGFPEVSPRRQDLRVHAATRSPLQHRCAGHRCGRRVHDQPPAPAEVPGQPVVRRGRRCAGSRRRHRERSVGNRRLADADVQAPPAGRRLRLQRPRQRAFARRLPPLQPGGVTLPRFRALPRTSSPSTCAGPTDRDRAKHGSPRFGARNTSSTARLSTSRWTRTRPSIDARDGTCWTTPACRRTTRPGPRSLARRFGVNRKRFLSSRDRSCACSCSTPRGRCSATTLRCDAPSTTRSTAKH